MRKKNTIVITVLFSTIVSTEPYGIAVPCPIGIPTVRTVDLKGKLGGRSIRDGSTNPAKVRYKNP